VAAITKMGFFRWPHLQVSNSVSSWETILQQIKYGNYIQYFLFYFELLPTSFIFKIILLLFLFFQHFFCI
jgi:hypothetical protein